MHQHAELSERIVRLARRDLACGTHLIATANRWGDQVPPARTLDRMRSEDRARTTFTEIVVT